MRKKTNFRRTKWLRIVLVWSFSILLVLISLTFYRQYREYRKAERQMEAMYNQATASTDDLDRLFSLIAQSESTFRLYSVDFDAATFQQYTQSLDSVKHYIDSLAVLPIQQNPFAQTPADIAYRNVLANEYTLLKKTVEQLVEHTHDSLNTVTYELPARLTTAGTPAQAANGATAEPATVIVEQDTIVRKRRSLFRRIFNARDDTIVVDVTTTHVAQAASPAESAQSVALASAHQADLSALRQSFASLQEKERQLVNANYALLNSVRAGIEKIRLTKIDADRLAEKRDFDRYRANTNIHNNQLILLLCLMLAMIVILWYYIRRVTVNELELENERHHVEKLAEEKSATLAGISHEIRTPLGSLLGTVDLIRKDDALYEGPQGDARKKILDSSYHTLLALNDTVNDILNLSRLESGTIEVALANFAPADTFRTLLALHRRRAAAKGLELREAISIAPELTIVSNEFRVKQIATNLVGNAIKYTEKGHVLFSAKIGNTSQGQTLQIVVKDTGIGIPSQHAGHVFRKYYTVEESKNSSGFGLGLYITKLLTEELEGNISVSSETGKGSAFMVEIPLSDSGAAQAAALHTDHQVGMSALPEGIRYLVVDDNPVNLLFMQQFLANQKHLETTDNPRGVPALLDTSPFDVVITDINMPHWDGWQLLEAIKGSGKYPHVKVLALSADTLDVESKNAHLDPALAFDGIIPKPFTEADFAKIVRQALDLSGNLEYS